MAEPGWKPESATPLSPPCSLVRGEMVEGPLLYPGPAFCFHLRLTHVLPRTGSRAGERRGSKFFRSSPARNRAERRPGLKRPLRGCPCPAGRLPLASSRPEGFAQHLLGKRGARGGRGGFRSPRRHLWPRRCCAQKPGQGQPLGSPGWRLLSAPAAAVGHPLAS